MTLIGDYRQIVPIGAGGMGEVWVEKNVHHKKRYALKLQSEELARVMSEMDHPGLVRVDHREIPHSGTTGEGLHAGAGGQHRPPRVTERHKAGGKWQSGKGPEAQRDKGNHR